MITLLKYVVPTLVETGKLNKIQKENTKVKLMNFGKIKGEKDIKDYKKFKGSSHLENRIKKILESKYNAPFSNVRLDNMINPFTKRKLELDIYNPIIKLAIEVQGDAHRNVNSYFYDKNEHKISRQEQFAKQKQRDLIKQRLCHENGITLVIIHDTEIRKDALDDDIWRLIQSRIVGF